MKSLAGSLIASVVGLAMLVLGIAGVAGAFEDDESDSGSGSDTSSEITSDCPSDDSRLGDVEVFDVSDGLLIVTCRGGSFEATYSDIGETVDDPHTLALWLARGKKRYRLVAARSLDYVDTPGVTGRLPANTKRYNRWIVSREPAEVKRPKRPTKIIEEVSF